MLAPGQDAAAKPAPDVLIFTNGDQLTGKLVQATGGTVTFHSDMAGDISVPFEKVKELRSAGSFALLQKDQKVVGALVRPGSVWSATAAEMEKWPGYGRDVAANRAEARRLLKEAGQQNLQLTLLDRNIQPYVTAGVFMIDQWRQIGVKVDHQQAELAAWYAAHNSGNFEVLVDSFTQFSDDPTNVLVKYVSYDKAEVAVARATDRELDRLFDEQNRTVDVTARKALVRQFEARAMEQAYAVPILWWQRIVAMNKEVRGWSMSPTHMIYQDLSDVWLAV